MSKIWDFIKRHKVLLIVLVVFLAIILFVYSNAKAIQNQLLIVETVVAEKEDLINSISLDGLVESEETKKIYTELTLPVLENNVEIGDTVKEGDVLGVLDTRTVEQTIAQQRATVSAQEAVNSNSISLAQKQLEYSKGDNASGISAQILQAEQAVKMAEEQLNQSEVAFDGAVSSLQEYRRQKRDEGVDTDDADVQMKSYQSGRDNAYASYETAKTSLASAKEAYEAAKKGTVQQVEGYTDSVESYKIASGTTQSQWIAIGFLEGDIERAEVKSPIDGVVTAVYAQEGATATGLLYVVENVKDLKITAALKEYDLAYVNEGNEAVIKSDATGDSEYTGKLETIAPTTIKTMTGDNQVGGTGEFETKISVGDTSNELKIGTKARVDIIYGKKENVITVPYEAITINAAGEDIIYVLEVSPEDSKVYDVREVSVELGIEGDFKIEIKAGEISLGAMVIKNAEAVTVQEGKELQVHIMADINELAKEGHVQAYLLTMEG